MIKITDDNILFSATEAYGIIQVKVGIGGIMGIFSVRSIDMHEYEGSKALWLKCFPEDSAEFVDYYYGSRTCCKNVIAAFDGDKLCSMLHIIPMRFSFGTSGCVSVGFVTGVCTLAEYRLRGAARLVIEYAISAMRKAGFRASVLQPSSVSFYEKFGYTVFSERGIYSFEDEPCPAPSRSSRFDTLEPDRMLTLYRQYMRPYAGMSIRSADCCRRILGEFSLNGTVNISSENAYALGYADGKKCTLNEFVYRAEADARGLLGYLRSEYDEVLLPLPQDRTLNRLKYIQTEYNMILPLDSAFSGMLRTTYGAFPSKKAFSFDSY